jgi:hypothetical protein
MKAKPLLVLLFFVLFIALFASRAIGNTDLTPDTPPAPTTEMFDAVFFGSGGSGGTVAGQPCGGAYTVRAGDTLTRIALICGVPLANLLAANPNITDPHRISIGQVIQIYYAPAPPSADVPPAAPTAVPTAAPAAAQPAVLPESRPEGLRPGGTVHVILKDLPPSTPVRIAIGKDGERPLQIDERTPDAQGGLSLTVAIPQRAVPGERWVVTVTSTAWPDFEVTSVPFEIEE